MFPRNITGASKQLLVIEEAEMPRGADGSVIYNKLKDLITNERVRVERKGVDAFMVENCMNIMLQGNRVDIFKLDEFDRRFAVLDVASSDIANNPDYWDLRWAALRAGLPEAVHAWLDDYDTREWDPYGMAPWTTAKGEMVETTHSPREQWIMELKNNPKGTLQVAGTEVDGRVATARELEYIYHDGNIPMWELDKKQSDAMSRALRLARVPLANAGNKIKGPSGPQRYFLLYGGPSENWTEEVKGRSFWNGLAGGGKV